jgi:DNA uptake protein ComE-like DNA-binding protein
VFVKVFVPINLNAASDEEMQLVPGVGARIAHEFDEYRPWEGGIARFRREMGKYVDEDEVARLEQYVFVPMDLNTASSEDLASIPGVGDRMVHEFEEYRPYVDMAQFRREMGKYVDDDEVARLERYFIINR